VTTLVGTMLRVRPLTMLFIALADEGALGDGIWNNEGDTYAPDCDLVLWDFMGCIDPCDSAACFTTDQIEHDNEMNWADAEYDRLTEEQYREMDVAARMDLLRRARRSCTRSSR
jgi:hypothetical protein